MIVTIWGLPRAGKTTALAWGASCALRGKPARLGRLPWGGTILGEFGPTYKRVFSNFPLRGCYKYNPWELGRYDMRDSLILCDETSLVFYSRDYRNNDRTALDWLCLHGHARCDVWFASQGLQDCDKRIRNLTGQLVHVSKLGARSVLTPVSPDELPDDPTKEIYYKAGFFQTRSLKRKRYFDMFDSFSMPELPEMLLEKWYE